MSLPLRPWIAVLALVAPLGLAVGDVDAQPAGVQYFLHLNCPPLNNNVNTVYIPPPPVDDGCPIRAVDGSDLMGDPSLAVDPLDPDNLILGSLHGGASSNGPGPRARSGQVFTTFTSQDGGGSWFDNPYSPPDRIANAFGIHPQVTIDPYGHVFVGSLYALPVEDAEGQTIGFDYVLAAQKFESLATINREQSVSNGAYNVEYLDPLTPGNPINQMWFTFNPATDNMTMVWHEGVPAPACEDDPDATAVEGHYVRADATSVLALWRETNGRPGLQSAGTCPTTPDNATFAVPSAVAAWHARAFAASPAGHALAPAPALAPSPALVPTQALAPAPGLAPPPAPLPTSTSAAATPGIAAASRDEAAAASRAVPLSPAWTPAAAANGSAPVVPGAIGVVWTNADIDEPYHFQEPEHTIRPCAASTNPVLSFGWLYVGCVADPDAGDFPWNPDTKPGTVELFRMDPDGGEPSYMGSAPPMQGTPRLGVRSDGRLALVSAAPTDDGNLTLQAAFGRYDPDEDRITWTRQLSIGEDVHRPEVGVRIVGAAVQDVIYREQSGALHLVLKTTVTIDGKAQDVAGDPLSPMAPHIDKTIVALDEEYGLLALVHLDIGDPAQRAQDGSIANAPEAAFQDLSDDFLQLPMGPHQCNGQDAGDFYQREFFAIGDYGTILFAELCEITNLRAPGFGIPPPPPTPVPDPATSSLIAPVVGASSAGLLATVLAANRRKNPLAAFTKDK